MGRQIAFHALPDDLKAFLEFTCARNPVTVTAMDSTRGEIEALADPVAEIQVMTLWNRRLVPTIRRELVTRQPGADYYRVPYSLPVLELSPSRVLSWNDQPALIRGRVYGFSFENAAVDYAKWYDALSRWIRSHFLKNPIDRLQGYIGPAALAWFAQGGILLPHEVPVTPQWESFVEAQTSVRSAVRTGTR
jgi:hypothetical protein